MSFADFSPLANHVWQSTAFALVIWLLALMLRSNHAHLRYWLWLTASAKLLVPFAALVAIGQRLEWPSSRPIVQPQIAFLADALGQPFSRPELIAVASPVTPSFNIMAALPILLLTLWLAGSALHILAWFVRWRRLAAVVRNASVLESGREWDCLRRLERIVGLRRTVTAVGSDSALEPGVFGILRPVLVWPRGISNRLTDHQIEALITHELYHIRRHDNLTAAFHMLVEAAFWLHPLVWWIERRLVDERERACDEAVIALGNDPQMYAESILKTCEFYVESPLVCVAGITGSDLKKRVEAIMRGRGDEQLTVAKASLLSTVGVMMILTPVMAGALNSPRLTARSQVDRAGVPVIDAASPQFEVASIKPNKSGEPGNVFGLQPSGRFTARNAPLRELIRVAYQLQDFQIVGAPSWIASARFDIEGKPTAGTQTSPSSVVPPQMLMLRVLLADRFNLRAHIESRELPIYSLIAARSDGKLGPLMRSTEGGCKALVAERTGRGSVPGSDAPYSCGLRRRPGAIIGRDRTMTQLANGLVPVVGRIVIDRTGLIEHFDFDLSWTPDQSDVSSDGADAPAPTVSNGPSIFTALQEQLGLKLEARRGPVDVLVIDSVQQPTSDDAALATGASPRLAAQASTRQSSNATSSPTFDVASIKPNTSGELRTTIQGMQPGGRFTATNMPLRTLIRMAFRLQDFQLSGGPKSVDSDRFDIVAKADRIYTPADLPMMLQTLLAERFKLAVHTEKRDLRVYELVIGNNTGKLGPRIHPSNVDCAALLASGVPPPLPEPGKVPPCATQTMGGRHMIANGMTMSQLAAALSRSANGIVLDQTGLNGDFDLELEWTPQSQTSASVDSAGANDRQADAGPSIFTAVQEQLGLRLVPQRGPVEVTVIDRIEQPTPD